jgi:hypothetical protein
MPPRAMRLRLLLTTWLVVLAVGIRLLAPALHGPQCRHRAPTASPATAAVTPTVTCADCGHHHGGAARANTDERGHTADAGHEHTGHACIACQLLLAAPGCPLPTAFAAQRAQVTSRLPRPPTATTAHRRPAAHHDARAPPDRPICG